jgi:hypothetical protein
LAEIGETIGMSKSGHYHGGSTLIGPRNKSWFGLKTPKWAKKTKNEILAAEKKRKAKAAAARAAARKKAAPAKPVRKDPGIKAEPSVADRTVTEVRQAAVRKKGGRAAIAVEYGAVRGRAKR